MPGPQPLARLRKKPLQARSAWTVDLILKTAAQILEREGEDAVTTARVAERAGVSIGSLYQYFANRDAILLALAVTEVRRMADTAAALMRDRPPGVPIRVGREVIRLMLQSFSRRKGARRQYALMSAIERSNEGSELRNGFTDLVASAWRGDAPSDDPERDRLHAYVATAAITGVLRTASRENSPFLKHPELEEALHRIIVALRQPPEP